MRSSRKVHSGARRRARPRKPDSPRRAPFPGWRPRPLKVAAQGNLLRPAHIRDVSGELTAENREYIRRKLGRRLGKFADFIERISVRTDDMNGPRGGIDKVCRIKVVLRRLPSVVYESQAHSLDVAVDRALAGTETAVRRAVQRRAKPPKETLRRN